MINIDEFNVLTPEEKEEVLKILEEYSSKGFSQKLNNIDLEDYKECPADIITFIKDDRYLGKAWHTSSGKCKLFPYWEEKLKILFPDPFTTDYNNFIESGARGLGKSEIAVTCGLYLMHRAMCLKHPLEHYNLKPTEKLAFAFMNITEALAMDIGISKFQSTVKLSPWFMERGVITGRSEQVWNPPDYINIIIGSQPRHVIGQPILFCLDGDTPVFTDGGIFAIKDLVDKEIKVPTINNNGEVELSDICTVKPTNISDVEYEIELEDGSIIKCTSTHRFMLKDGTYKQAQDLTSEDELFDLKKFGYVYKFTNLKTNKIYIGKREKSNFDESYYGGGKIWKEDLQKYGKENILREILCWAFSREELNILERFYINKYNSQDATVGYNIHKGGQGGNSLNDTAAWSDLHKGPRNGRYHMEVSKETCDKISRANCGKVRSQECKDNMSKATKGKPKPSGFGDKISKKLKGRKNTWARKPVVCVETNEVFESLADVEKKLHIHSQNVGRACKEINYKAGGFNWRYLNED